MRKKDREKWAGVIWASSMEVPEMPESYSFTGYRNTVMPKALMMLRLP